eukprot:CAMPEP_0195522950 /NCGR_PEP_ID=MMETSP0794_2-20130614/21622_1 /TAXON_ID=515487 /ORGANISM="Stephanopyxis turris, Strain CCMP 815" /LENGTH=436 /DNA_ID=CAMNT_0040652833 /DNA_START=233 /DNA_END=1543 /DNA_ORIENTATION=-
MKSLFKESAPSLRVNRTKTGTPTDSISFTYQAVSERDEDIPFWSGLHIESAGITSRYRITVSRIWIPKTAAASFSSQAWKDRAKSYEHELPLEIRSVNNQDNGRSERCEFYKEWHSKSFPTCNVVHEVDFPSGVVRGSYGGEMNRKDLHIDYIMKGTTREAWKLHSGGNFDRPVAFKNIRFKKEYIKRMYEHQRIDALATERLTSSEHVIDMYGFCGESVLNQFADGGDLKHALLEMSTNLTSMQQLIFARDAALGLADIHGIDGKGELATLVHHDVKEINFLVIDGKLKFHDFNNGQFLRWDFKKNERCGFSFSCEKIEAGLDPPEECTEKPSFSTEKIEVFRLGVVSLFLLTAEHIVREHVSQQSTKSKRGKESKKPLPILPLHIEESDDPAIRAIIHSMREALTVNAEKRPSARMIADELSKATLEIQTSLAG